MTQQKVGRIIFYETLYSLIYARQKPKGTAHEPREALVFLCPIIHGQNQQALRVNPTERSGLRVVAVRHLIACSSPVVGCFFDENARERGLNQPQRNVDGRAITRQRDRRDSLAWHDLADVDAGAPDWLPC